MKAKSEYRGRKYPRIQLHEIDKGTTSHTILPLVVLVFSVH